MITASIIHLLLVGTGILLAIGGLVWRLSSQIEKIVGRQELIEERLLTDKTDIKRIDKERTDTHELYTLLDKKLDLLIQEVRNNSNAMSHTFKAQEDRINSIEKELNEHNTCFYYLKQKSKGFKVDEL